MPKDASSGKSYAGIRKRLARRLSNHQPEGKIMLTKLTAEQTAKKAENRERYFALAAYHPAPRTPAPQGDTEPEAE